MKIWLNFVQKCANWTHALRTCDSRILWRESLNFVWNNWNWRNFTTPRKSSHRHCRAVKLDRLKTVQTTAPGGFYGIFAPPRRYQIQKQYCHLGRLLHSHDRRLKSHRRKGKMEGRITQFNGLQTGWLDGRMNRRINGWIDGRTDGRMGGRVVGWMDGWKDW